MLRNPPPPDLPPTSSERPSAGLQAARLLAFLVVAGLVLAYALPGGAYDIVVRQEYGLVIWWVLGLSFAFGLLPRARPSRLTMLLVLALLAYALWTAISLAWTESPERATAELARVVAYLGLVALLGTALTRPTWRAAAQGLGFGAALVCVLCVAHRLSVSHAQLTVGGSRLSYPFGYWNAVGAWGAMTTVLLLAWSAHDRVRVRRALALAFVPAAVLTTYLSYSRAGAAATIIGVLVVIALSRHRITAFAHVAVSAGGCVIAIAAVRGAREVADGTGNAGAGGVLLAIAIAVVIGAIGATLTALAGIDRARTPRSATRGGLVAGAVALAFAGGIFGPALVKKGLREFRHPALTTTSDPASRLSQLSGTRYQVWRSALSAFDSHPALGIGAGSFEFWWDRRGTTAEFVRNAHSLELENLAELGVPGLVLILGVLAAALALAVALGRRSRRRASSGAAVGLLTALIVYLLQASVDWMWQSTAVTMVAFAGAALAGARLASGDVELRWYGRGALALAAVGASLVQVPGLLSTVAIRDSQAAQSAGHPALALASADTAVDLEPWAASPYLQRGLVLESAGNFRRAAGDLHRAVSNEPKNFRPWLVLARIETERGGFTAAERDLRQARALRPLGSVFAYAPLFSVH